MSTPPAGQPAAAATPTLGVHLTAEEGRLIREPGDRELLNAVLTRAVGWAWRESWREAAAKTSSLVVDSTTETIKQTARGVVEGLALHGNPRATVALLEAERRTDAERWRSEAERLRVELDRALAAAAPAPAPAGPLRVVVEAMPPRRVDLERDDAGRVTGASVSQ